MKFPDYKQQTFAKHGYECISFPEECQCFLSLHQEKTLVTVFLFFSNRIPLSSVSLYSGIFRPIEGALLAHVPGRVFYKILEDIQFLHLCGPDFQFLDHFEAAATFNPKPMKTHPQSLRAADCSILFS